MPVEVGEIAAAGTGVVAVVAATGVVVVVAAETGKPSTLWGLSETIQDHSGLGGTPAVGVVFLFVGETAGLVFRQIPQNPEKPSNRFSR